LVAVVTAAGFVALVALGVTYAVTAPPQQVATAPQAPATRTGAAVLISTPQPAPAPGLSSPAPRRSSAGSGRPRTASPTLVVPRPSPSASPWLRPSDEPLTTLDLTIASFNVLGASHTRAGGDRPGYAPGAVRARGAATLLDRYGADVIGFQELQVTQLKVLQRVTDLQLYPALSLGRLGAENSIGWRRSAWRAVERHTVTIPYFDGGPRAMPVVRLRSVRTGLEAWFANFHNPAETARFHHQQRFRTQATLIEARLATQLVRTGLPVFVTGDMNERAPFFCRLTSRAPMLAARGGTNTGGRCRPGRPRQIDWIFGSQGVQFTGYKEVDGGLVDKTSDHPLILARARITGEPPTYPRSD
jgi:Endonuclease/Exonuclease/phosphatase family